MRLLEKMKGATVNAVMLKELRQATRNKVILGVYVMFLFGIYGVIAMIAANASDRHTGFTVFMAIYGVMSFLLFFGVPIMIITRMFKERAAMNADMMFVTSMSPAAIVRGKTLSMIATAALVIAASAPFLAFSYMLRGISLFHVFLMIALQLATIIPLALVAIFIGSLDTIKLVRGLLVLGLSQGLLTLTITQIVMTGAALDAGPHGHANFVDSLIAYAIAWVVVTVIMHSASVAALSPVQSNRMLRVRVAMTVMYALSFLACWIADELGSTHDAVERWAYIMSCVMCAFLVCSTSERAEYTRRQLKSAPKTWIGRVAQFPFHTGQMNGLVWSAALMGLSMLAVVASSSGASFKSAVMNFISIVSWLGMYAVFATVIWRHTSRRIPRNKHLWLLLVAEEGIIFFIFMIVIAIASNGFIRDFRRNPFSEHNAGLTFTVTMVFWVIAVIVLAMESSAVFRRFRRSAA